MPKFRMQVKETVVTEFTVVAANYSDALLYAGAGANVSDREEVSTGREITVLRTIE